VLSQTPDIMPRRGNVPKLAPYFSAEGLLAILQFMNISLSTYLARRQTPDIMPRRGNVPKLAPYFSAGGFSSTASNGDDIIND